MVKHDQTADCFHGCDIIMARKKKTMIEVIDGQYEFDSDDLGWCMVHGCLLYTSPSPRDGLLSRMPSSA